tara:strand:+ start:1028 stop:1228 length:201 start_codon:yes stop_codon:yes gene_type:complete
MLTYKKMNTQQTNEPKLARLVALLSTKQTELKERDPIKLIKPAGVETTAQLKLPQGPVRHNGQYIW